MEFPSFHPHHHHHHHQNRYVPPAPPKNFSDDNPNLYPHRHHFPPPPRLPPPPLLSYPSHPQPPPLLLPVPPPPPSYNPQQSNFTFLDSQNPPFLNQRRSSPPQPRFSNQSHRFDYRTDSWSDPHRIPPELPQRKPILPDNHHRRLCSSTPQSESYYNPNGSERAIPSSRYRSDTIIDGYSSRDISNIVMQDPQVFRGSPINNDHHGRIIDRYESSHSVTAINEANGSSSRNLEDFVEKYEPRYMTTSENDRIWDRLGNEDPRRDHSMKGKRNEFGHGGNDGPSIMNPREQSRNYDNELTKFNRVREGREEFKQVQKKSVLLRIGKLNNTYRNRNHEQHFSKAYFVESSNSNFRGKDKDRDHIGKDSSLYLDKRMEGDREHSPVELDVSFKSNGLVAKAVVTPSSPVLDNNLTQPRTRKIRRASEFDSPSTRSGSSSLGLECPSSSEKAPKQLRDKDSVYDGADGSLLGPVPDQGGGSGGSNRPLSFRLRKKRKFMNLGSDASNILLADKDDKSVKGENIKDGRSTPIIPFPPLEELIASNVAESPEAMLSEKHGSEAEHLSLHDINSFGDDPTENKTLTVQEVSMINDSLVNDRNQQLSQNEAPLNLENDTQMVSTDVKVSLGGADGSASSHDQIEIPKCTTESCDGIDAANISNSLFTVKMQEMSTTADMNSIDPCSEEIIMVSPENDDVVDDVLRKEEETKWFEGTTNTDGTSKPPEDGPKESSNVVVAEVNAIRSSDKNYLPVIKRKTEDSKSPFNLTISGEKFENIIDAILDVNSSLKEISSDKDEVTEIDKDEVTEIVNTISALTPDHREPSTDESYLLPKDDLPAPSTIISACADGTGVIVTNSNDKPGEPMPDSIISTRKVSSFSGSPMLSGKSTEQTISNSSTSKDDGDKPVSKDDASLNGIECGMTSQLEVTGLLANTKTALSASQGGSVKTQVLNKKTQGSNLPMKKLGSASAVPRAFAGRSSPVFTNSRINNPANIAKPRTWLRSTTNPTPSVTKSSLVSVPPLPKQIGTGQNSYIRSGNTLVRKGAPVNAVSSVSPALRSSVYQLNPSGPIEMRNNAGSGSKVHSIYSRTGGPSASVVRPKTPPLSGSTKLPDCTTISSRDFPSSPVEHLPTKGNCDEVASPVEGTFFVDNVSEYHKISGAREDQNVTSSTSEGQKTLDEGTAGKQIQYLKRKANQLIAASNIDQPEVDLDKTQASDGYYKRRKNQLIRASVGDGMVKTDVQKASKINVKRQSVKGVFKKYKHLRFPSVWTLSSQSSGKDGVSLRWRPHLLPWKRSRYRGNVINVSASTPGNSSSSSISRKLLLSRKREMIYTRSRHGFSLRMSKLLSVGGASLKWSKSIERNSKKANEEATIAVAAADKKKREQHETSERKNRNNMSRDRIYRIGLVRYKMDPSRRTLQRISDEEPSTSVQSKEEIRSYVPKRLKIGHNEYVRIGNGNQLVRNPKRRTRIFAYEKVRSSLHTARSRLAKKKKYCQFFTRFGKCSKEDGKCPYIHDSSKIAVCTKFLNGSCSNPNCKLTHKVIPERMQDCSYFLQGFCSNEQCPYRHVNVNSAASICEGFLKGYCADGNECRKKHTYACPVFEATGTCPQGTNCKLHHPKNRNMGLKRKQQHSMEQHQKNARGRYFGSIRSQDAIPVSEKHHLKDDDGDALCQEGKFAEYISLDFSNEEAEDVTNDQQTMMTSEPTDLGASDSIELTKPVGIMNEIMVGSPSEGYLDVS